MKRFVKHFVAEHSGALEKEINTYAEQNKLLIVQVSYSHEFKNMYSARAMVLFERIAEEEESE